MSHPQKEGLMSKVAGVFKKDHHDKTPADETGTFGAVPLGTFPVPTGVNEEQWKEDLRKRVELENATRDRPLYVHEFQVPDNATVTDGGKGLAPAAVGTAGLLPTHKHTHDTTIGDDKNHMLAHKPETAGDGHNYTPEPGCLDPHKKGHGLTEHHTDLTSAAGRPIHTYGDERVLHTAEQRGHKIETVEHPHGLDNYSSSDSGYKPALGHGVATGVPDQYATHDHSSAAGGTNITTGTANEPKTGIAQKVEAGGAALAAKLPGGNKDRTDDQYATTGSHHDHSTYPGTSRLATPHGNTGYGSGAGDTVDHGPGIAGKVEAGAAALAAKLPGGHNKHGTSGGVVDEPLRDSAYPTTTPHTSTGYTTGTHTSPGYTGTGTDGSLGYTDSDNTRNTATGHSSGGPGIVQKVQDGAAALAAKLPGGGGASHGTHGTDTGAYGTTGYTSTGTHGSSGFTGTGTHGSTDYPGTGTGTHAISGFTGTGSHGSPGYTGTNTHGTSGYTGTDTTHTTGVGHGSGGTGIVQKVEEGAAALAAKLPGGGGNKHTTGHGSGLDNAENSPYGDARYSAAHSPLGSALAPTHGTHSTDAYNSSTGSDVYNSSTGTGAYNSATGTGSHNSDTVTGSTFEGAFPRPQHDNQSSTGGPGIVQKVQEGASALAAKAGFGGNTANNNNPSPGSAGGNVTGSSLESAFPPASRDTVTTHNTNTGTGGPGIVQKVQEGAAALAAKAGFGGNADTTTGTATHSAHTTTGGNTTGAPTLYQRVQEGAAAVAGKVTGSGGNNTTTGSGVTDPQLGAAHGNAAHAPLDSAYPPAQSGPGIVQRVQEGAAYLAGKVTGSGNTAGTGTEMRAATDAPNSGLARDAAVIPSNKPTTY